MQQPWGRLCKEQAGCSPNGHLNTAATQLNPLLADWFISISCDIWVSLCVKLHFHTGFTKLAGFPPVFHHLSRLEEQYTATLSRSFKTAMVPKFQQLLVKSTESPDSPLLCKMSKGISAWGFWNLFSSLWGRTSHWNRSSYFMSIERHEESLTLSKHSIEPCVDWLEVPCKKVKALL